MASFWDSQVKIDPVSHVEVHSAELQLNVKIQVVGHKEHSSVKPICCRTTRGYPGLIRQSLTCGSSLNTSLGTRLGGDTDRETAVQAKKECGQT